MAAQTWQQIVQIAAQATFRPLADLWERTNEEEHEGLVVGVPNTVVDPGAVVVHAQNTAPAHSAVVRARRLVTRTLLAEPCLSALRDRVSQSVGCMGDTGKGMM